MATSETAAAKGEAETLRANAAAWSKEKAELLEEISVLEQVVDLLPKPDMGEGSRIPGCDGRRGTPTNTLIFVPSAASGAAEWRRQLTCGRRVQRGCRANWRQAVRR